jgi:hypothetical protein
LFFLTSAAVASSHSAPAGPLSLSDRIAWEIEHFLIHLTATLDAVGVMLSQPAYGWALLEAQSICSSLSGLTPFFFGSAEQALATVLGLGLAGLFALMRFGAQLRRISLPRLLPAT